MHRTVKGQVIYSGRHYHRANKFYLPQPGIEPRSLDLQANALPRRCKAGFYRKAVEVYSTIIALKASGRDCTNNNELFHKIGVLQRYAMQLFVFTRELYNLFYGAVSITVVLRETDKKVEGSSPSKAFFILFIYFFFFAFANMQEFLS